MDSSEAISPQSAVKAMAVVAAIGVTLFAIWADYYSKYFDELQNSKELDEKPDPVQEIRRIRVAGGLALIMQVLTWLGSAPIRHEYPLTSTAILLVALLIQGRVQSQLEKKVTASLPSLVEPTPLGVRTEAPKQQVSLMTALAWGMAGAVGYLVVVYFCIFGFMTIAKLAQASAMATVLLTFSGGALGIFIGLGMIFGLAPYHLRKILPTSRLTDDEKSKTLATCFESAKLPSPEVWVIEQERFGWNHALLAGFPFLKGKLSASFFVTRSLIENLSADELKAVTNREISHVLLQHMRKRFTQSLLALIGSSFLAAVLVVGAYMLLPEPAVSVVRVLALLIPIFLPVTVLIKSFEGHEFAADIHAITTLNTPLTDLIKAIEKIDRISSGVPNADLHPNALTRIQRLRTRFGGDTSSKNSVTNSHDQAA